MDPTSAGGPPAPDGAPEDAGGRLQRRAFVLRVLAAVGGALAAALGVSVAGLAAAPALVDRLRWPLLGGSIPPTPRTAGWQSIGPVDGFEVGVPKLASVTLPVAVEGATEPTAVSVYVVRPDQARVLVFDIHCTHMGCPVAWSQGAARYLCPCHGGAFTAGGDPTAGPPPRPLDRYQATVSDQQVWLGPLVEPV